MPLPLSATDAELWSALLEQHSRIANVSADIAAADIQTPTELLIAATDSAWVLLCAYLCFIMSLGFALVGAGSVKALNTKNALMQSGYALLVSIMAFWILGFGLMTQSQTAMGDASDSAAGGIGDLSKAAVMDASYYAQFLFLWSFVNACCCIVAASVTSRMSMMSMLALMAVTAAFTFPLPAWWVWGHSGWLSVRSATASYRVLDHAGGTVVHVVGGVVALTAAWIVGPRYDRFVRHADSQTVEDRKEPGHSVVFAVLGTFLLWFGWFGMNAGSTHGVTENLWQVAALASINTVLAAGAGSLAMTAWHIAFADVHNLWELLSGLLCGLVAITSGCAIVDPWAAILIGTLSILPYRFGLRLLSWLRVDDVVESFAVHGCCGAFGTLMTGLLASQHKLDLAYGAGVVHLDVGPQLGVQLLAVCVVALFAAGVTAALLLPFKFLNLVRVSREDEAVGLDGVLHGGYAYPDFKSKLLTAKNQVVLEAELGAALKKSAAHGARKAGSKDIALDVVTDKIRQLDEMRKAQTTGQAGGNKRAPTTAMDAHRTENSMGAPVSKRDNYVGGPEQKGSVCGPPRSVQTRGLLGRESNPNRDSGAAVSVRRMHTATATAAGGAGAAHKYLSVDPMASINAGTPGANMFFIPASPPTAMGALGVASANDVHAFEHDATEDDVKSSPSGPSGSWEHEGGAHSPLGSPTANTAPASPPYIMLPHGQELMLPSSALGSGRAAPSSSHPSTPARPQKGQRGGAHSRKGSTEMTELTSTPQQQLAPNSVVKIRIAPSPSGDDSAAPPAVVRLHRRRPSSGVIFASGGAGVSDGSSNPAPLKPALRSASSVPSQSDTPGLVPDRESGGDRDSTPDADGQERLLDPVEPLSSLSQSTPPPGGTARGGGGFGGGGDDNATERRLRILKEEDEESRAPFYDLPHSRTLTFNR